VGSNLGTSRAGIPRQSPGTRAFFLSAGGWRSGGAVRSSFYNKGTVRRTLRRRLSGRVALEGDAGFIGLEDGRLAATAWRHQCARRTHLAWADVIIAFGSARRTLQVQPATSRGSVPTRRALAGSRAQMAERAESVVFPERASRPYSDGKSQPSLRPWRHGRRST
jgi:hypothetical protein